MDIDISGYMGLVIGVGGLVALILMIAAFATMIHPGITADAAQ